jgi:hypothetical protein
VTDRLNELVTSIEAHLIAFRAAGPGGGALAIDVRDLRDLVTEVRRLEAADVPQEDWRARALAAEAEVERLRDMLGECAGWMEDVSALYGTRDGLLFQTRLAAVLGLATPSPDDL